MGKTHSGSVAEAVQKGSSFPLGNDSPENTDSRATATCYCGTVQLSFPTEGPGFVDSFICNCTDCRKITASMFASNFTVRDSELKHVRGQDKLSKFGQSESVATHKLMTNYFCSNCGTLMYRVGAGFPDMSILRIGTVDDFRLAETKLKPRIEQFTKDRVGWFKGAGESGVKQYQGNYYAGEKL